MTTSKLIKIILLGVVYGLNLLFALAIWLCSLDGNILLGIIFMVLYRLSLWSAPWLVTIICWLPLKPLPPVKTRVLFNIVLLLLCGALFVFCRLAFGTW